MSFLKRMFSAPDPPYEQPETRDWSIADPTVFAMFGASPSLAGVHVSEQTALGLSAVFRSVSLIAGGIATLPLRAIRENGSITERTESWLDNPAGGLTRFELVETTMLHLLLHGNGYLAHIYNKGGALCGLSPLHPQAVSVDVDKQGNKVYKVSLNDGTRQHFTDKTMTHVKWLSLDGVNGLSPLQLARNGAFGTSIAADRASASQFGNGMRASAVATFDEDTDEEDGKVIQQGLDRALTGEANSGRIALINRKVTIHPWQLSNADMQYLESRQFQIEEIARIYGVPATLIGLSDKQSSWGTGIAEMHRAMAQWTFKPWTTRIEQRISPLLVNAKAEFEYKALLSPDPATEIELLIKQKESGLLTDDEVRAKLNMPPLPKREVPPEPEEDENV